MAGENKISDKKLRALLGKKRDNQIMISDGKGMSVRVSKNGCLSFVYQFRLSSRDKNTTWLTLGKYPDLSLSAARKKRDECRSWLAEGKDPRIQIKNIHTKKGEVTVKEAIHFWFDNYARKKRKLFKGMEYRINKYVINPMGNFTLASITNDMWFNLFDKVSKQAPTVARELFQELRQAIRYCNLKRFTNYNVLNEFQTDEIGESSNKRSRYLLDSEIKYLWFYANQEINCQYMQPRLCRLLYIALVFGCRISEAINSTWEEWELEKWIWTVPVAHSKNGEKIIRPIPHKIRNWILGLKQVSKGHKSIIGIDLTQPQASGMGSKLWRRMGHKEHWTLHDLRRTFATHLCDLGVDHYVIEQLLGHTLPGVMGIYNRSQQLDKKLNALNLWVDYLDSLLGEEMIKIIGRDELNKIPKIDRIIRDEECEYLTSIGWKTRNEMQKAKKFPKKIPICKNIVGYRLSEIQAWVNGTWKPE